MTKRKRNECCTRISDCVNAKYFANFLKDVDLLHLSKCNSKYYSDFYRYFANRSWWSLQNVQHASKVTLNYIRKLSFGAEDDFSMWKFPQHVTSLSLINRFGTYNAASTLLERYKNDLQFLEVVGNCDNLQIPEGLQVFVQTYRDSVESRNIPYYLRLPNSLSEVTILCFENQFIESFPSQLKKLTLDIRAHFVTQLILPIFPTTLLHLTLMDGFNQFIAEFPSSLMSLTIQNNIWNQRLLSLPAGLQYLKLYGNSMIPLDPGVLPESLKIFIYKSKCNIQENVLPFQLKYVSITIGSQHGSMFDCKLLPQGLVKLNINSFHPFGVKNMKKTPIGLQVLKYKTRGHVQLSTLPQQLETLYLQTPAVHIEFCGRFRDGNHIVIQFPPTLRHLSLQVNSFFGLRGHVEVFPDSLQTLYYNCNSKIHCNMFPKNLKFLLLGKNCKRALVYSLPKSLQSFNAPHLSDNLIEFYQKTQVIPKSCFIKFE
jgi:hypothetical protein